jgi:chaperonin GroES
MKKIQVKPLGENVLIKPVRSDKKTDAGIYLPDNATQERPQEGIVVATGDSKDVKVKKNQKVIFNRYGGTEVKITEEDYLIVKSEDILAIID